MTAVDSDLPMVLTFSQLDDYDPGRKVLIPTRVLEDGSRRGVIVQIQGHHEWEE